MNKPNNKRKKESIHKIEQTFLNLIQTKEISEISVTEICQLCHLNRSTFYANFLDVYDLANHVKANLEQEVENLYLEERSFGYNSNNFLKLFQHIYENQLFYKTYFKLGYDRQPNILEYDTNLTKLYFNDEYVLYHLAFFKSGFNSIVKLWLENGCQESPEEMCHIIESEYQHRNSFKKE